MATNEGFDYNRMQSPQNPTFIVANQPGPLNVGPKSMSAICPSCRAAILTKTSHNATSKTHCAALCLCLCLCWLCCCIPYCMDSCQNTNHYCPNCDAFIGTYQS